MGGEPGRAPGARERLAVLRQQAATTYDAITAAETALRDLAGRRVAAERSLRAAWQQQRSAVQDLDAHAQVKPGLRALLGGGFAARREWRRRRALLAATVAAAAEPVAATRRAVAVSRAEFAAAVRARAEAVDTLRRLTAACADALQAIPREPIPREPGTREPGQPERGSGNTSSEDLCAPRRPVRAPVEE